MITLKKNGTIVLENEGKTLGDVMKLFIAYGNISLEPSDSMAFIDAMRKYHRKIKFRIVESDKSGKIKFIKEKL